MAAVIDVLIVVVITMGVGMPICLVGINVVICVETKKS
jgi:hypothetical protein